MAGSIAPPKKRRGMAPNSDPNVIPFIDIMLVLLIIFMVAAPIPTVDIKVDLPPANSVPKQPDQNKPTFVVLKDTGGGTFQLFVDDQSVGSLKDLGRVTLQEALIKNPGRNVIDIYKEARIYLKADQETIYKNVIDVMNALQDEGFTKVGIFAEAASS